MIPPGRHPSETERLRALAEYQILDSPPEQEFDDLTSLAVTALEVPIALVVLVDEHRQWFKAKTGLVVCETPREQAFCSYTILENEALVVEDALQDPRFAQNPLVLGPPHIRFYAGVRLVGYNGHPLGSFCIIDQQPRRFTSEQLLRLERFGRQATRLLEFRRVSTQLAEALRHVQTLSGLLPICSYCKQVRDDDGYWQQVEAFVTERTGARFSHGICPRCLKQHYPNLPGESCPA